MNNTITQRIRTAVRNIVNERIIAPFREDEVNAAMDEALEQCIAENFRLKEEATASRIKADDLAASLTQVYTLYENARCEADHNGRIIDQCEIFLKELRDGDSALSTAAQNEARALLLNIEAAR